MGICDSYRWINRCLAVSLLLVSAGCGHTQSQQAVKADPPKPLTKPAPPTPLDVKKAEVGAPTWDPAWDRIIETNLPPEMLSRRVPRDVRRFCPRFYQLASADKRAFWAYLFQAMAAAEAGLNPTTNVQHTEPQMLKVDTVTHEMVHQEGLLQLTYQDDKLYGCDFDWEVDRHLPPHDPRRTILTPRNNLLCGIKILTNQMFKLHEPLFSRKSYWSTLQTGTLSYEVFAKQMTDPPAACELKTRTPAKQRSPQPALEQASK